MLLGGLCCPAELCLRQAAAYALVGMCCTAEHFLQTWVLCQLRCMFHRTCFCLHRGRLQHSKRLLPGTWERLCSAIALVVIARSAAQIRQSYAEVLLLSDCRRMPGWM